MEEQIISFETAKLAKEKGFRENSRGKYYTEKGRISYCEKLSIMSGRCRSEVSEHKECFAPTQSLLQKWIEVEHDIYAYIDWANMQVVIYNMESDEVVLMEDFEYNHHDERNIIMDNLLTESLKLIKQ